MYDTSMCDPEGELTWLESLAKHRLGLGLNQRMGCLRWDLLVLIEFYNDHIVEKGS